MNAAVGRWKSALVILLLAASCTPGPGPLSSNRVGLPAPAGLETETVDGLTVGHRLMAAGEFELALQSYTRAISEQGLNVDILSALGSANLKLGRLQQSRTFLGMAIDRDDQFVPAWNNLGVTLTGLREFREAREAFRVAFSLDGGRSEEIRQNLILAEENVATLSTANTPQTDLLLVRRGNGRYLLLTTTDQ